MSEHNQTLEAIDKSTWGDGPWQSEPDRHQWQHAGYACLMVRHEHFGYWCAYVGVDRAHPQYGKDWRKNEALQDLDIGRHINYSASCGDRVCHVPEPGMPDDVWWLGMDFGHAFELAPAMEARDRELAKTIPALAALRERVAERVAERPEFLREVYRDFAYVQEETEALARALRLLEP